MVLQDTKRGQERSWGLSNENDEVRHLEYTADSKSLFLSTKVTNAVQCYSTQRQRLLSPPQMLSSPPVALAVSPSGHLMISAEGSPPVVYLKDLVQNSAGILIQAQASSAAVAVAAFHPERANVFLLGFEDGTLAVFDASRLARVDGKGLYANQEQVAKGEIGRLNELHRPSSAREGGGLRAITGAAFLPGYKARVATVGTDGRCKLVDFAEGGNVLRTWHGKAPLTSVSVYGPAGPGPPSLVGKGKQRASELGPEAQGGALIAVGSEDGRVLLYDALGLLQARKKINKSGERIISVEWIAGLSLKPIRDTLEAAYPPGLSTITSPRQRSRRKGTPERRKGGTPTHLSLHPALQPPKLNPTIPQVPSPRRFTVHPDEIAQEGTVRRTPSPQRERPVSTQAGAYTDLFSPVNPFVAQQKQQAVRPSPSRKRPRISSQTFSRDNSPYQDHDVRNREQPNLPVPDHVVGHSSDSRPLRPSPRKNVQFKPRKAASGISPLKAKRPQAGTRSQRGPPADASRSNKMPEQLSATAAANARLLRDLHQMNAKSAGAHAGSILQSYAGQSKSLEQAPRQAAPQQATVAQPPRLPVQTHIYGRGGRWPTDSVDESSWDDAPAEDDIWITSDEERHHRSSARRHHLFHRPPARQTSRSRVDSKGTMDTGRGIDAEEAPVVPQHTHDGAFSPQSEDVRNLFPRSSSLSPSKKRRSPKKRSPRKDQIPRRPLAETTANAPAAPQSGVHDNHTKSKATYQRDSGRHRRPTAQLAPETETRPICRGCAETAGKVHTLEGEVAHLKGEILALRAALRKHGIPAPNMPRH